MWLPPGPTRFALGVRPFTLRLPLLTLLGTLVATGPVASQPPRGITFCPGAITMTTPPMVVGMSRYVTKTFHFTIDGPLAVTAVSARNGAVATPAAGFTINFSLMSNTYQFRCARTNTTTVATSASCSWVIANCSTLGISIGPTEGLPVELMEFDVDERSVTTDEKGVAAGAALSRP